MSNTPPLPVSSSNRFLTVTDDTAIVAGDVLAKPGTGERIVVLKIEQDGIIYYSSTESDYGYYPGDCLREDFDGVGNNGDPVLELVDEDPPTPITSPSNSFTVTVWTPSQTRTVPDVTAIETEFGDTNTVWLARANQSELTIEAVGAVVESVEPQPRTLPQAADT